MKRLLITILIASPILYGCSSDPGSSPTYKIVKKGDGEQTPAGQGSGNQQEPSPTDPDHNQEPQQPEPNKPGQPNHPNPPVTMTPTPVPPRPTSTPVPPRPTPTPEPVVPPPTQNGRGTFGQPGRQFDIQSFIPAGFSPEKTLSEAQYIRERSVRGCKSGNAAGLTPGSEFRMAETTFHQADNAQVFMRWVTANKLTSVQTGNVGYNRTILDFRSESEGADIVNKNEKCSFVFGAMGGTRRCAFIRGNDKYRSYVDRLNMNQQCRSVTQNSRGSGKVTSYMKGKFTLPNGRTVSAILAKTRSPRLETCGNIRRNFTDYTVQVFSEKVQSADGTCATLFDLTIYQAEGRYSEWNKVVQTASLKR